MDQTRQVRYKFSVTPFKDLLTLGNYGRKELKEHFILFNIRRAFISMQSTEVHALVHQTADAYERIFV